MAWSWNPFARINDKLDRLQDGLNLALSYLKHMDKGLSQMASQLDAAITQLQSDVSNLTSVDQSAIALINGIAAQVQAAVQAALAAGATPAELLQMTDLSAALQGQATQLAAAVSQNTPPPAPPQAKKKP